MKIRTVLLGALLAVASAAIAAPPSIDQLTARVPADATAVVAVDVAALRAQPTIQKWLLDNTSAWSGTDDDGHQFLREAGLDPFRDVDSVVTAVRADGHDGAALILAAGRFDPAALSAALVKRGAEAIDVRGMTAYRVDHHGHGDTLHPMLLLPGADLVMVGTVDTLTAALATGSARPSFLQTAVDHRWLDLTAPFWMAVEVPEAVRQKAGEVHAEGSADAEAIAGVIRASTSIRSAVMYARLGDTLEIHSTALASSAENAGLLRDTIKGALAAMRLQAQDRRPELVDVLRGVDVTVDGSTVSVEGAVPVALIEQLANDAHGHREHAQSTKGTTTSH